MALADVESPPSKWTGEGLSETAEKSLSELIDETFERCEHCGRPCPPSGVSVHEQHCSENPDNA